MTLHEACFESHVSPVRIGLAVIVLGNDLIRNKITLPYPCKIVLGIEDIRNMSHLLPAELHVIRNPADTLGSAFGGHENDTITC